MPRSSSQQVDHSSSLSLSLFNFFYFSKYWNLGWLTIKICILCLFLQLECPEYNHKMCFDTNSKHIFQYKFRCQLALLLYYEVVDFLVKWFLLIIETKYPRFPHDLGIEKLWCMCDIVNGGTGVILWFFLCILCMYYAI